MNNTKISQIPIIDSSSVNDIENPALKLTLGQTFQTWDEAEKFSNERKASSRATGYCEDMGRTRLTNYIIRLTSRVNNSSD
ncbi:hypothetical protein GLOIN_2v680629 [Rhizophagus clarus]|uniref:Uncharacterized protein n=1 Tax=Rhizophagus clarus TaxID=94130 RepID=A0A8H3R678_9GLOM|nr:hypothetical protein GLOIN_2v680629 [Rhizophagus clarus]